ASGLLAGKYDKNTEIKSNLANRPQFQDDVYGKHLANIEKLREIAQNHNVEVAHIVLAFYLTKGPIDAVIPGARNSAQVIDNLTAASVKLTEADLQLIESVFPVK